MRELSETGINNSDEEVNLNKDILTDTDGQNVIEDKDSERDCEGEKRDDSMGEQSDESESEGGESEGGESEDGESEDGESEGGESEEGRGMMGGGGMGGCPHQFYNYS